MQSITIDRSKPLREESNTGHNRWHPDIPPVIEVDEGEEVVLETRDAFDGQMRPWRHPRRTLPEWMPGSSTRSPAPVAVKGAAAGRLAGGGVCGHPAAAPRVQRDISGVRVPAGRVHRPLHGALEHRRRIRHVGADTGRPGYLARRSWECRALRHPMRSWMNEWTRREAELASRGGVALPPDVAGFGYR